MKPKDPPPEVPEFEPGLPSLASNCLGLPGGFVLTKPPYGGQGWIDKLVAHNGIGITWYTAVCIEGEYGVADWPYDACPEPCVVPRLCVPPSPTLGASTFLVTELDPYWTLLFGWAPLPASGTTPAEKDLLESALSLLMANRDIVEWVVCLALSYSPYITQFAAVRDKVLSYVDGAMVLFTVDRLQPLANPPGDEATGTAVDATRTVLVGLKSITYSGSEGVVIPVGIQWFQDLVTAYLDVTQRCRGLCAVLQVASVILHEILHLSAKPPTEPNFRLAGDGDRNGGWSQDDCLSCWAVQNMSATGFTWAISQRYPALKGLVCCPQSGTDLYFLSSQPSPCPCPDGTPCELWSAPPEPHVFVAGPC